MLGRLIAAGMRIGCHLGQELGQRRDAGEKLPGLQAFHAEAAGERLCRLAAGGFPLAEELCEP